MKAIRFFLFFSIVILLCLSASAQHDRLGYNVVAGFSPLGKMNTTVSIDGTHIKCNYKTQWGIHLGYENRKKTREFASYMAVALDFGRGELDTFEMSEANEALNLIPGKNLTYMNFNVMYGLGIPLGERFRLPLHIGPGFSYLKGGYIHNACFAPMANVRLQGYITNSVGLYAGVNGRLHLGAKKINDSYGLFTATHWDLEVGLVFSLGAVEM